MPIPDADRTTPIKWEDPSGGDTPEAYGPTGANPNKDALQIRGIYGQPDAATPTLDEDVWIGRDGDDWKFQDKNIGPLRLQDLAGTGVFGDQYQVEELEAEASTTSPTFVQRLRLTTPSLPAGDYRIEWYAELRTNKKNKSGEMQVELDDTDVLAESEVKDDWWQPRGGKVDLALGAGAHTIDYEYRRVTGGTTAYIRRVQIAIWRTS